MPMACQCWPAFPWAPPVTHPEHDLWGLRQAEWRLRADGLVGQHQELKACCEVPHCITCMLPYLFGVSRPGPHVGTCTYSSSRQASWLALLTQTRDGAAGVHGVSR